MKNITQFFIFQEDEVYTAEGLNVPIVTEGKTFEELKKTFKKLYNFILKMRI